MSFSKRLPLLPSLRDFINMYGLRAKRILAQNYLMDMNMTRKVVRTSGDIRNAIVYEVGPGPGGLTRAILERNCARLDVVEIDHRFVPALRHLAEAADGRMHVHHADVLEFDIEKVWHDANVITPVDWLDASPKMLLIGNLPFNISTPLIIRWLKAISQRTGPWSFGRVPLTLTFQYEVAERIIAPIDHPQRSRLSIMAQTYTEPRLAFKIPGRCFVPEPDVDAAVVCFVPREEPLIKVAFELIEKLVKHIFHYRQKRVITSAMTLYPKAIAKDCANEMLRLSRVSTDTTSTRLGIDEFADMCYVYEDQCKRIPGLFLYDYRHKRTLEQCAELTNADDLPMYRFGVRDLPDEGVSLADFDRLMSHRRPVTSDVVVT